MTSLKLNVAQLVQQSIDSIPLKYRKIISSGTVVVGFWIIRNAFWKILNRIRSYPAGPLGLPFFGCFFPFGISPAAFIIDLGRRYGSVAYVPLMMSNNLFINDPVIVKQLFQTMKITDHPLITHRKVNSFAFANGDQWSSRRKFFSQTAMALSNSSFVLSNVRRAMDSVEPRMDRLIEQKKLWFPNHDVEYLAINNAWTAIFDHVLSIDDPFVAAFCKMAERVPAASQLGLLVDLFSNYSGFDLIARHFTWKTHDEADELLIEWMNQNGFEVDRDRKILQRVNGKISETKVYADFLIDKLENGQIEYDTIWPDLEIVLAGAIDTTSQASSYGFLLLAKYPVIQQQVYGELGLLCALFLCFRSGSPSMFIFHTVTVMEKNGLKDFDYSVMNQLHIFRAFIHEMLRISSIGPLGVPHYTTDDVTIEVEGKKVVIPKWTVLYPNFLYIQKWTDWNDGNKPLEKENNDIHLEYWLNAETGKFKMNDNFMLFSVGKRDCVGRSLAMKSMYAMFAFFVLRYKFVAPDNDPDAMEIKQKWSLVLQTQAMGINVELR